MKFRFTVLTFYHIEYRQELILLGRELPILLTLDIENNIFYSKSFIAHSMHQLRLEYVHRISWRLSLNALWPEVKAFVTINFVADVNYRFVLEGEKAENGVLSRAEFRTSSSNERTDRNTININTTPCVGVNIDFTVWSVCMCSSLKCT